MKNTRNGLSKSPKIDLDESLKILLEPYTSQKTSKQKAYVFKVLKQANKYSIKEAVKKAFDVEAESVRISNVKSCSMLSRNKKKRIQGFSKAWKKAYVTLKNDSTIDFGIK